ncbi:MAG: family 16 glycoside hydrolase [Planctomycetota bacterium]|jgi:tetratricopeptide (TPR) repeat protein
MTPRAPALLAFVLLLGVPMAVPVGPGDGGARRFVEERVKAARVALRAKDWEAADRAWNEVLELDPRSLEALEGLVETAKAQGDRDAEVFARTEWHAALRRAISAGESSHERPLAASRERLAALDPMAGEADELLADYRDAQAELARRYQAADFPANALAAWGRHLRLCEPGSAEEAAARAAMRETLESAPDEVARRVTWTGAPVGHDEAWIAEFDRKSAKWSQAGRWETPHYRIKTNAGWKMGNDVAAVMERVHAFYREIWGIMPDPPPEKPPEGLRDLSITPIEVNIYATRDEYTRRAGEGAQDWSGGNFTGSAVNTYNHASAGGKGTRATMSTLFHEASHQFMSVAVGSVPSFVNEGVASLFEGIEILSNGNVVRDLPVPGRLMPLADLLEKGTAKPLRSIFNAPENKPELYNYRWGVMYFLRMYVDEQGTYVFRQRLQDYIYEFKKGSPGDLAEHFEEFVLQPVGAEGIGTFDEFEAVWGQWIIDLAEEQRSGDKRLEEYRKKGRLAGLKDEHEASLRFYDKALDIDRDDLDALYGLGEAAEALGLDDRALASFRRFVELAPEEDKRRSKADARAGKLDPEDGANRDARRALAGGMAALALKYDQEELPRMAMRSAIAVLDVEPFDPSARAMLRRLERDTGLSVVRWQRLFNGFDLDGWYGAEGDGSFFVKNGELLNDSSRVAGKVPATGGGAGPEDDAVTYQALVLDRKVDGDFSVEAHIVTRPGWQIAGIIFGARDTDHYEAIVLRKRGDGTRAEDGTPINNVDFGSFDSGGWTFRGDGSVKAAFDPEQGVVLRVDVRGREVAVSIDGEPVHAIVGKRSVRAMKYPLAALRGDVGLLASRGITRFNGIRLLAGAER